MELGVMDFTDWIKFVSIPGVVIIFTALWHIQRQLTALRVEMAQDYVSHRTLIELEKRLVKHLERMEDKIDTYSNHCKPAPQRD